MTNNKELTSTHFDNQKMENINNKQQSSVEWFLDQLIEHRIIIVDKTTYQVKYKHEILLEQAKAMEKEQRSIEVPSDEEIGKEASVRHYGTNFKHVFASGAKWMRDKIQGGEQ
jgi:predicted oxidoreductase